MSSCVNFEWKRKTSHTFEVKFKKDGVATEINGWTVYFTMKKKITDSDANATLKKDITDHYDVNSGITLVDLTRAELDVAPGSYLYEIEWVDDDGNGDVVLDGRINIVRKKTNRS